MHEGRIAIIALDVAAILSRDLPWETLSGCRVLVTGASGFLGGYLVRVLLALNRAGRVPVPLTVIALVRNLEHGKQRLADVAADAHLHFLEYDLNAIAIPAVADVNYILHAASNASPRHYNTDPVGTILPNTVGTAALLEILRASNAPRGFLYISSSEVYGAVTSGDALREDYFGNIDPTSVRSCYGEGKKAGEAICTAYHHQFRLPIWIVRPFHTYGPGLLAEDGRVFSDFAYNVRNGEDIVMNSDGSAKRAFCYVSDAIAGFFTVLFRGQPGLAFNVANRDEVLSVRELALLLVDLFPEKGLKVMGNAEPSGNYMVSPYLTLSPDTDRIVSLGWSPQVPSRIGFSRMIRGLLDE